MIEVLNNRELSILIWLSIIFLGLAFKKGVTKSYADLIKAFFQDKVITLVFASLVYVEIVVLFLALIDYWEIYFLKDTIFWYLGTGFILLLNTRKALSEKDFFRKVITDNVKLIVILQFITNFHTFGLFWEVLLVPIVSFVALLDAMADHKSENRILKKLTVPLLTLFGLSIFSYSIFQISTDFGAFTATNTLKLFLLPIILSLLFVPFLYFVTLIMEYENLFLRIGFRFKKSDPDFKKMKIKMVKTCHLNLNKLKRLSRLKSTQYLLDKSDFEKTINELKSPIANNE